jgi:hypothetical protein
MQLNESDPSNWDNLSLSNLAFNYKIVDKSRQMVPLTLNVYQQAMDKLWDGLERDKIPVRIIVLKARQTGISTYCQAKIYNKISTNFFQRATVIADDDKNTTNLFNMSKIFWKNSHPDLRPMRQASNEKALILGNPDRNAINAGLQSSIHLETAGKGTAGRGSTNSHLHCSEFAFWPDAATVVSGLFQSIPANPGTSIVIESTANGMTGKGQEFYERWMRAEKDGEEGGVKFYPLFFPWFWNPEYELEPAWNFEPTTDEKEIQKQFPQINERKLAWRRYKIKNEMGSARIAPEDQFLQEYPASSQEAFLASGRPVFPMKKLQAHIEKLRGNTYKKGTIDSTGRFYERPDGPYTIYTPYQFGRIYAIGADVAEGLVTGDFSTMAIINRELEFVGSYWAHIAPDLFGLEMVKAGKYFSSPESDGIKALLAMEINNHGHSVLSRVKEHWSNIYTRQVKEERSEEYTLKLGWQTNLKSKMEMLDDFVGAYRDDSIKIYDIELLKEMLTVYVGDDGDIELGGKDRVVAACIALQAIKQVPYDKYQAEVPDPDGQRPRFKNLEEKLKWLENQRTEQNESYFR